MLQNILLCICILLNSSLFSKIYDLSPQPMDVVIPCCAKDEANLELCITSVRKYCKNIRRIIIVSEKPLTKSAEWFDEALYPFSKKDIALQIFHQDFEQANQFLFHPSTRIGWIYQQLLKLYAPFVIPDLSPNVLIVDADVIFLKCLKFMTSEGEPIFTLAREYHRPYFTHMSKLLPQLTRVHKAYSGIVHHMLFQRPVLEDLFQMITAAHGVEPWRAICLCIDPKELFFSCLSEYEMYFNFILLQTKQVHLRNIQWANCTNLRHINSLQRQGYYYVACHKNSSI